MEEETPVRRRGLRLSIRYKMLLVICSVLFVALASYLYLAINLFTRDKVAYIYDLTSSLVGTHAEETGGHLSLLGEKLVLLGRHVEDEEPAAAETEMEAFLAREAGIVRLEIFRDVEGKFQRALSRVKASELDDLRLEIADLEQLRDEMPVPFADLRKIGLHVQNTSLPPDADLLTVAVPLPGTDGRPDQAMVADVRTTRLLPALGRAAAYTTYLVDREGVVLVHPDTQMVVERTNLRSRKIVTTALDDKAEQGVQEFTPEDGLTQLAAYSRVGVGGAAVITEIDRDEALQASQELLRRSLLFGIAILLAAFVASILFSRLLTKPILQLQTASRAIGEGDFDTVIPVRTRDEIGELADALRDMTGALQESQARLVESEKMAAFGQIGAGIAQEISAPLTGIIGAANLAEQMLGDPESIRQQLGKIARSARRCNDVLGNFIRFTASSEPVMTEMEINEVVQGALALAANHLDPSRVQVVTQLGENLPRVEANAVQVQQVILNLLLNAQESMPNGGGIIVETGADQAGAVFVGVTDSGIGIDPKLRMRIFEPFFTTKGEQGHTGLGLSIAQRIVRDHGGTLGVGRSKDQGTTFRFRLPVVS